MVYANGVHSTVDQSCMYIRPSRRLHKMKESAGLLPFDAPARIIRSRQKKSGSTLLAFLLRSDFFFIIYYIRPSTKIIAQINITIMGSLKAFQLTVILKLVFLLSLCHAIELEDIRPWKSRAMGPRGLGRRDMSAFDLRSIETFLWGAKGIATKCFIS